MTTLILLLLPLIGVALVYLAKSMAPKIALAVSLLTLATGAYIAANMGITSFSYDWIPAFNIHFAAGIDGISMVLVLLTVISVPLIILASFSHKYEDPHIFYALILLMQAGMLGVFVAKDAFMFYVCYELSLVPIYFICGRWGGKDRVRVTLKFFIFTLFGSLFMLAAIIFLYTKTHSFNITDYYNIALSPRASAFVFWSFFLAFAVKMPIFPFHSWQPETYTTSPYAGTMLLAGVMLKMGIYGFIRLVLPVVPSALDTFGTAAMVLCICGIIYGAVIAIRQNDLKTLIAFSSLSHVGLIGAGVFAANEQGLQGAVIQMFNHGINVIAMFLLIDIVERITKTRLADALGGLAKQRQGLAIFFMIILLGSVGLPLTNGFIGEFLLLMGIYGFSKILAVFAGLTIILGAVYMLNMYRNIFFGDKTIAIEGDMTASDKTVLYITSAIVIIVGVAPNIILYMSQDSVQQLLTILHK